MPGNTFGKLFCVTTWGESHGPAVGAVIDGCPPGVTLKTKYIQSMLDKRKPGTSAASTSRKEPDKVSILSGVFNEKTTGTPICVMVQNKDARSKSYDNIANLYRPGHGDWSYTKKYGIRDYRGGGRASARETVGRVAAGAVAAQILAEYGISVMAYTTEMGGIKVNLRNINEITGNPFGCPDKEAAEKIQEKVLEVKKKGDSIGGVVEIIAKGVPAGFGEPVFDKLDARIAYAMMGVGAVKAVEIGAGIMAATAYGSFNNDSITEKGFSSNNAGGVLAGISSGQNIVVRAAVKPIPSIGLSQNTVDLAGKPVKIKIGGRHDICAIPRINVVLESMMNLVLVDFLLQQRAITH